MGRGLESLINGGLMGNKQPPSPKVEIDSTRIEKLPPTSSPKEILKKDSKDLNKEDSLKKANDLLKKAKPEADDVSAFNDEIILSNSSSEDQNPELNPEVKKATFPQIKPDNTQKPSPSAQNNIPSGQGAFMLLPLAAIRVSPFQRRKEFPQAEQRNLIESIRSEGLMQPVVVRPLKEGGYELIAGERRMRACEEIGMEVIPARVVAVENTSAAVMGLIENLQRVDLNPVEEARGYGMLLTDFHMTQEQIAQRVGKDRSTIANSLRLLLLEVEVLGYIAKGQLSVGHAKVLLGLPEGPERVMLARAIVEQGLSVRAAEAMTRKLSHGGSNVKTKRIASVEEIAVVKELEERLKHNLNTKVSVNHSAKGGKLVVYYKSNIELEGILKKMGV